MSPQTIGRYKIKSELGRGGMAVVYRAHDPNIDREVALKLLPREFSDNPNFLSRFQREIRTIGKLENPAVVPIHDSGEANGQPFLVMRLMQGGSLQDRIRQGALSLREATDLFNRLAPALDEAHAKGIIHRDLKPGNILLDGQGNPYLSDFGIVKLMESTSLNTRGAIGTPAFMSPEHYDGKVSPQSDIYAMGVILFHMLTGQYPFQAKTPPEWLKAHLMQPVPNIREVKPDLPPTLTNVIETAMAKEATGRYDTVGEMAQALREAGSREEAGWTAFSEGVTIMEEETQDGLWLTDSTGGRYELQPGSIILGRSGQCDVRVNDRLASREHATLEFDGETCTVYDEGSANGTFLNEKRLEKKGLPFRLGDTLRIGEITFELRRETMPQIKLPAQKPEPKVDTQAETDYRETVMSTELSSQQDEVVKPSPPMAKKSERPAEVASSQKGTPISSASTDNNFPWTWIGVGAVGLLLLIAFFAISGAPPAAEKEEPAAEVASCKDLLGCVTVAPDDPIRIASALVTSGSYETLGIDSQHGVEIAIDDYGEVAGHSVELQAEDSGCSAEGGQTAAQKIASDESISGVIVHNCSSSCTPAAPIYNDAGLTMISTSCTFPALTNPANHSPSFLRIAHNDNVQGRVMAEYVYNELGLTRAATIYDGSPYAKSLQQVFADVFTELGGKITAQEAVNIGDTEMRPVLTSIAASGPEFIYYPILIAEGAFITVQSKEIAGLENVQLAGADGMISPDFITAAGEAAEGMLISGPDLNFAGSAYDDFLAKHKAKYGVAPPSAFHAHAYDATTIILTAIDSVVQTDEDGNTVIGRQALRDVIYATSGHTGITGNLSCNENGDCADPEITINIIQDGEYVPVGATDHSSARFVIGDGVVTDNQTGLIWLRNANCADDRKNWDTALANIESLNTNGTMNGQDCGDSSNDGSYQTDWRLPNREELESLIDKRYKKPAISNTEGTGPWINGAPFYNIQSNFYWSSSTYTSLTDTAWYVNMNDRSVYFTIKSRNGYVWPVRGGQ